jgi:uncharacterized protein (TIGR02246 family)
MSFDPSGDAWEIRELVERYASAADRADGEAVATLFTTDGQLVVHLVPGSDESSTRRGHDEITTAISWMSRYAATQHVIANSVIDVDGDAATGRTQCTAHHVETSGGESTDTVLYITYDDRFTRVDDKWRIERRELRVRWTEVRQVAAV